MSSSGYASFLVSLFSLLVLSLERGPPRLVRATLAGSVGLSVALVLLYGTWIVPRKPTPTWEDLSAQKRERLAYRPSFQALRFFDATHQIFVENNLKQIIFISINLLDNKLINIL